MMIYFRSLLLVSFSTFEIVNYHNCGGAGMLIAEEDKMSSCIKTCYYIIYIEASLRNYSIQVLLGSQ